ncbi:hypothetical protein BSN82_07595 [Acinetobacter baylyi]|nr:hypothetical protein F952_01922 [Acinetobacter baylyi DSM 14961 = CIP 107474]KAF2373162.1 hypothetical protein BSL88_00560 [Acinetobacter baylyi]MAK29638.1 hypothetical protein [Acinetobacter sp.]KAF2374423.1 hypothetical protein BSL67_07360 [Acinetobacter baylyi]KAF2377206.1 hypothetical protein BSN81_10105 [Acinetobacter baylyi]
MSLILKVFFGGNMDETLGVFIFYLLILFALSSFSLLFYRFDLIFIVVGLILVIIAFLFKSEFKLRVCFWKKT